MSGFYSNLAAYDPQCEYCGGPINSNNTPATCRVCCEEHEPEE